MYYLPPGSIIVLICEISAFNFKYVSFSENGPHKHIYWGWQVKKDEI